MENEKFIKLLNEHLQEKYEEYISLYSKTSRADIKLKYMYLGRANSYMELMGFLIRADLMECLYKECLNYEKKV